MIEYPYPTQYIYIDTQGHWFKNEFAPLVEEHFPNREEPEHWNVLNLFMIPSNDSYQLLTWEEVVDVVESNDTYEYLGLDENRKPIGRGNVPEGGVVKPSLLDGTYQLTRDHNRSDIHYIIWAFVQKGLIPQPELPLLFFVWW